MVDTLYIAQNSTSAFGELHHDVVSLEFVFQFMNRFYYKSKFISHKIISLYRTNEGKWRFVCTAIDVSSWLPAKTSAIGSFLPPVTRKMLLAICPIVPYLMKPEHVND